MPIGYVPLQGAAEFGQGLGNALSNAFIQIPMQKRQQEMEQQRIGLEGRQINNQLAMREMMLQLQGQRYTDLNNYRQGMLDSRNDYNDGRLDVANRGLDLKEHPPAKPLTGLAAQGIYPVQGGYFQTQPGGKTASPLADGAQGAMPPDGFVTPPTSTYNAYPRQFAPVNPNSQEANQINLMKLQAGVGGTNTYPQILQMIQQMQQQPQG